MMAAYKSEEKRYDALCEQDKRDLARFRAALRKLTAAQKREVIHRMLVKPDTP